MRETAIYIHIPFCDHKCIYCDFYSITSLGKSGHYHKALTKEIETYSKMYNSDREIVSIYFGGGTPSLMEPDYIGSLINCVRNNFNVSSNAEITLETNPGTVNRNKLAQFLNAGINRISIGVQSFNQKELKFLTRIHDSAAAEKTVYSAYDSGFENISIDLIFNLPGQSIEKWSSSLERTISMPVKHISAYSLILEHGTILNKMVLDGKIKIPENEIDAGLYEYTIDFLERHGFMQYEVSNFALNGFESVHNKAYWQYKDYLSFGTSAHSFDGTRRWWNFTSLTFYLKSVFESGIGKAGEELLTGEQKLEEFVMLSLRSGGLDTKILEKFSGSDWLERNKLKLSEYEKGNFLIWNGSFIKLTSAGYALCDEILANLN